MLSFYPSGLLLASFHSEKTNVKTRMTKPTFEIEASLPTSERAALMSNAALGCYVKLMCCTWREGSIPSDLQRLARLCGEPPHVMAELWEQIQDCFIEDQAKPGRLTHVGLEQQRLAANAVTSAKSKAGRLGAQRRWGDKAGSAGAVSNAPAPAPTEGPIAPFDSDPDPEPIPSPATAPGAASMQSDQQDRRGPQADLFGGAEEQVLEDLPDIKPTRGGVPPCPQGLIIDLYHQLLPTAPRVMTWGPQREALLRQRWREMATTTNAELGNGYRTQADGLDWWGRYFTYVSKSHFLSGRAPGRDGGAPFLATLEWLIRPKNFPKVLEGHYHRN